ncbi:hypothetical protein [Sphingomonas aerophila]|uniref:Uncharacterized protein n=1 Tax=Sphingomonas aerophila TaxID=1344948 RepID=A0A7W9EV47_9SPHN|nr:hypothetical protein [Sphingomonas aerophila]MBB5715835.1 hypothetical protein [Sphingomonas aerophila]
MKATNDDGLFYALLWSTAGLLVGGATIALIDGYRWNGLLGPWLFSDETSNFATLLGYVLVAASGLFAYQRWGHDRRIKRIELLMERLGSFNETPGARNAVMMLYNHDRMIPLWDQDEPPEKRYVRVTWAEVEFALIPHPIYPDRFDPKLSAIRDCFEDYLSRMGQIWIYLELGVITSEDARKILAPWLRRFGLVEQRSKVVRNLRLYIRWRKLEPVERLFATYDVDLTDTAIADWQALDVEVNGEKTTDAYAELRILRPA